MTAADGAARPPDGERAGGPGSDSRAVAGAKDAELVVAVALAVSSLGAVGLAVVYWTGGQPQLEGLGLFTSLAGIGLALVVWGRHLLGHTVASQEREPLASTEDERNDFRAALDRESVLERRTLLRRMLALAVVALGAAAVFPFRSLGPRPTNAALEDSPWRAGMRLVDDGNQPIRLEQMPEGGLVTAFPEDLPGSADGQVALVRIAIGDLQPLPGREDWSPAGLVAYSRVCTHAGCPVGLYLADSHELLCPCHQSAFDVLHGADPTRGPAARPLPQLPLTVDDDGFVVATGDFSAPVGPAWWSRP
jgi:ubiquinol-cytochrome c reductase iron-sulfur subunit